MNIKKTAISLILVIALFFSASAATLAWLSMGSHKEAPEVGGSILGGFFHSGDGNTKETAYTLTTATHVYNLAWLQYLGEFNKDIDNDGSIDQVYFKVLNDIDLGGLIIPPIGTREYPFLGNFNGGGHCLSNFTVSNYVGGEAGIENRPSTVVNLDSVNDQTITDNVSIVGFFGVVGALNGVSYSLDPGIEAETDSLTKENLVTNSIYDLVLDDFSIRTESDSSLIGLVAGYVNGTVSNVGVGVSEMFVGKNTAPFTDLGTFTGYSGTEAGQINDLNAYSIFSLVGAAYKDVKWSQLDTLPGDSTLGGILGGGQGDEAGLGGSIKIQTLLERLGTYITNPTVLTNYVYMQTAVKKAGSSEFDYLNQKITNDFKRYTANDSISGSVVFDEASAATLFYLAGGCMTNEFVYSFSGSQDRSYKIFSESSYLKADVSIVTENGSDNDRLGISTGTIDDSTDWIFSDGYLYASVDNQAFFLNASGTNLELSRTPKTIWTLADGNFVTTQDNIEYTLCFSAGTWLLSSGAEETEKLRYIYTEVGGIKHYLSIDFDTISGRSAEVKDSLIGDNPTRWIYDETTNQYYAKHSNGTIYYLRGQGSLLASTVSTTRGWTLEDGKFVYSYATLKYYLTFSGAAWSVSTSGGSTIIVEDAAEQKTPCNVTEAGQKPHIEVEFKDYRLVFDENNASYVPLNTENGKNTGYVVGGLASGINNGTLSSEVGDIRISKNTGYTILDSDKVWVVDNTGTPVQVDPTSSTTSNASILINNLSTTWEKYANSTYGLHFMDSRIRSDETLYIPTAHFLGSNYSNYEVPADCIDFKMFPSKGLITFFAGTFYSGNDCFFSLHEIIRYTSGDSIPEGKKVNDIKEIKEIKKIYQLANGTCCYTYISEDGIEIDDRTDGEKSSSKLVFDTAWLTSPTLFKNGYLYYFEIPVNGGEYALGSVENGTGAYLLYLDIGANAAADDGNQGSGDIVHAISGVNFVKNGTTSTSDPLAVFRVQQKSASDDKTESVWYSRASAATMNYKVSDSNRFTVTAYVSNGVTATANE